MNKFLGFALTFLVFFATCKKTDDYPYVYVNQTISVLSYIKLQSPGGYQYFSGGIRGIIVYCNTINEYVALDRACSKHPKDSAAVVYVDKSGLFAKCKSCGSQFLLIDGSVSKSPATYPLKMYTTQFSDLTKTLRITN